METSDRGNGGRATDRDLRYYLEWIVGEIRGVVIASAAQAYRLIQYAVAIADTRQLRQVSLDSRLALGEELYQLKVGSEDLRCHITEVDDRIKSFKAADNSTKELYTERIGLLVRLADSGLADPSAAGITDNARYSAASAALDALHAHHAKLTKARSELFPKPGHDRTRITIGYAVLAVVLLLPIVSTWLFSGRQDEMNDWQGLASVPRGGLTASSSAETPQTETEPARPKQEVETVPSTVEHRNTVKSKEPEDLGQPLPKKVEPQLVLHDQVSTLTKVMPGKLACSSKDAVFGVEVHLNVPSESSVVRFQEPKADVEIVSSNGTRKLVGEPCEVWVGGGQRELVLSVEITAEENDGLRSVCITRLYDE